MGENKAEAGRPLVIGVRDLAMRGWMAGRMVTRTMALSLRSAGAEVAYVTSAPDQVPEGMRGVIVGKPRYLPLEWTLRGRLHLGAKDSVSGALRTAGVGVLLPTIGAMRISGIPSVGWIPDFQHLHLPDLFTAEKIAMLDREFGELAGRSARVLLSSENARNDFVRSLPQHARKARVASFPSLFAFEPPAGEASRVLRDFGLPERFLLVINQFWRHKNHRVVVEALVLLKRSGRQIPLVMAGLPVDFRDPENSALTATFQAMARGGVAGQCVFLGKVERQDIVDLLRSATAVVQPSRFEGWNTTVQDAKALGCPILASDLPVHREQCPGAVGFFPPDGPEQLARILAQEWDRLPSRPDPSAESAALAEEVAFARTYGEKLLAICAESAR